MKAKNSNFIILEQIIIKSALIFSAGLCYNFLSSNIAHLKSLLFQDFQGFSNDIFLFSINLRNLIILNDIKILGYFSLEQFWSFTCIFRMNAMNNILNISNSLINSSDSSDLKMLSLIFFKIDGDNTSLSISNSSVTLINYFSFLISETKIWVTMRNLNFKHGKVFGNLLSLKNKSFLILSNAIFHDNLLSLNKSILSISENTITLIRQVSCNTNIFFLSSDAAFYNITRSQFVSKDKFPNSNPLFLNKNHSIAFYQFIEVFLRENIVDSNIIIQSSRVTLKNSTFGFSKAFYGGIIHASEQSNILIESNKFISNQALLGGVIYFDNVSYIGLIRNYFYKNEAVGMVFNRNFSGKGGCVYANIGADKVFSLFEVSDNYFILGGSEIGGVIYAHDAYAANYILNLNLERKNRFKKIKVNYIKK